MVLNKPYIDSLIDIRIWFDVFLFRYHIVYIYICVLNIRYKQACYIPAQIVWHRNIALVPASRSACASARAQTWLNQASALASSRAAKLVDSSAYQCCMRCCLSHQEAGCYIRLFRQETFFKPPWAWHWYCISRSMERALRFTWSAEWLGKTKSAFPTTSIFP